METKVKLGDKFKIIACRYNVPEWSEGSPCVILKPCLQYCDSDSIERVVEDFCIDVSVDEQYESHDRDEVIDSLEYAGTSLSAIRRAVNKALQTGKNPYKNRFFEVVEQEIEITEDQDGDGLWAGVIKERLIK